jgi:methionine salvage enolase-phosphatase E1
MFHHAHKSMETSSALSSSDSIERDVYELKALDNLEKRRKRRTKMAGALGALALSLPIVTNAYWADVDENRQEQAEAAISINVIREASDEDDTSATIFIDGFNTYDADYFTKTIGPTAEPVIEGEQWSLGYNNAILSRENIYTSILEMAKKRNKTNISIFGYSMGGIIAAEATCDIVKNSDVEVDLLTMMHTPDGYKGLRENQKKELGIGQWLASNVPGAIDSSAVRFAGALAYYKFDFDKAMGQFNAPKRASMQLLSEQVYKIDQFDMLDELECISKEKDTKRMPTILALGTGAPGYDYMVNDTVSLENYEKYSDETDLPLFTYRVPGAIHSLYYKTVKEYTSIFQEASKPVNQSILAETARRAFELFAQEESEIDTFKIPTDTAQAEG